jgi:hypothetical protein
MTSTESAGEWRRLRPELAPRLTDARLQVHHAAQLAAAIGISYLPAESDDSHTNLEWNERLSALVSRSAGAAPTQLAVRLPPFELLTVVGGQPRASFALDGCTMAEAVSWVREQLAAGGLEPGSYTLPTHYVIPPHPVGESAPFDAHDDVAFGQLAAWYSDSARVLSALASSTPNASPVRCWPHHFDIATLIDVGPTNAGGRATVGLGMEPGDAYYAEPYFYASLYPSPSADAPRAPLEGSGLWHTRDWVGAVLPGSRLTSADQRVQVDAFLASALRSGRELQSRQLVSQQ